MRNDTDAGTDRAPALDAIADRTGRAAWLVPATNRVPLHSPRERDGYGISSEVDATDPPRSLYLADGHPAAYVFDDENGLPDGMPFTTRAGFTNGLPPRSRSCCIRWR